MKTAMYLRQSLDRDENKLAVDRQREDLLKLCAARGWDDPLEYCDNSISASTGKRRPAYEALCGDIRNGVIGRVAVWDLDRLHRHPMELETFIIMAEKHDIQLASVGGDADLSDPNGQAFARMKGMFARLEVQHKSKRQKAANAQRARAGKSWVHRAFGYDGNEVVPSEAKAIRAAYTALLGGDSLLGIARHWNTTGVPTVRGARWTGGVVRQILLNCRYAGLQKHQGEILEGVQADWPAIVPRDTWEAACTVLSDPARHSGKTTGRKHLLTGLAVCGLCHRTMGTTQRATKTCGKRVVYQCKRDGCMRVVRDLHNVDDLVTSLVCERLAMPDAAAALAPPTVDTALDRDRVTTLRARLDSLANDFAEGDLTSSQLKTATARIKAKLAEAESKLLDANQSRVLDGLVGEPDAAQRFAALPLDRQRAVIDALCTITIEPSTKPGGQFDPELIRITRK